MPNGKLSATEYDIFEKWFRGTRPFFGAFQTPPNREGIRKSDAYKEFLVERPFARITETTRAKAETGGFLPSGAVSAPATISERVQAIRDAGGIQLGDVPPIGGDEDVPVPPQPTESPPEGFRWAFDRDLNRWVPQFAGLTAQQTSQQDIQQQQLEFQRQQALPQPISPYQQSQIDLQRQQFEFTQQQAGTISPFQQQQFGLQQQQVSQQQAQFQQQLEFQQSQAEAATAEQERQFRSQLAANPINWLQYAAYTGQPPVVQPWMIPLGFQNQGGGAAPQLQAGQPIPGFQPTGGDAGGGGVQTFANLPQLTTPSAQLQARWGPTAQAQFLGFRQARTGASPQETQFRLGAGRAPAGRFPGFSGFSRT